MPVELKVPDDATKYLNQRAMGQFREAVRGYAEDLLKGAGRLEATSKSVTGDPEITSTMVKDAVLFLRRGWVRPAKKPLLLAAQLVALVGGLVVPAILAA